MSPTSYQTAPPRDTSPTINREAKNKITLRADLLSQGATPQLSSALACLTTEFEKGSGGSTPLRARREKINKLNELSSCQSCATNESKNWLSPRPISTGQLNTSPCLHTQPINPVVYRGS